ncbi:transmembrane protein 65 isoform X6 [Venturia canescens]|uniref:transmembrane protein 65 isoform X6 n=1 Tax=Venturia canescens TaxID=32260 RepID=UPI001C9CF5B4|nr:transmembrane protein 65 isoform X6 [Venturia canescens]
MCTSSSLRLGQRHLVSRQAIATGYGRKFYYYHNKNLVTSLDSSAASGKNEKFIPSINCRNYGSAAIASSTLPGALSKQQAKDLAVRLTPDEREILISALQECQSHTVKAEYEADHSEDSFPLPKKGDLMRVSVANAIPFIGFGFLDNFIMIIAGEHIETSLGAVISLTTMAAAALGNTISDILGIGSAFYVELLAQKIGFKPPKLTPVQLDMPVSRRAANMGRVIGVTIGCILGMTPLLLMGKDTKTDDQKVLNSQITESQNSQGAIAL